MSGPVSRSGAARAPSGVSSCCSSPLAHRALITISACLSGPSWRRLPEMPRPVPDLPMAGLPVTASATHSPTHARAPRAPQRPQGSGVRQISSELAVTERYRRAQRSRNRPAAPGSRQAVQAGMQVRSPARSLRSGVSDDLAAHRHHAKQVGLSGSAPAPNARTDHRSGHARKRGPHGRPVIQLTGPARRRHLALGRPVPHRFQHPAGLPDCPAGYRCASWSAWPPA